MDKVKPQQTFHFLIPDCAGDHLLVCKDPDSYALPSIANPDELVKYNRRLHWTYHTNDLAKRLLSRHSLRIHIRVLVRSHEKPSDERIHIFLAADLMSQPKELPEDIQWISREQALKATWAAIPADVDMSQILAALFAEVVDGVVPINRAVWRRVGWFHEITSWAFSVLRENSFEPLAEEIEQLRNTSSTAVLRLRIKEPPVGPDCHYPPSFVFVKCSVPASLEAKKTSIVSSLFPDIVPRVFAVHPEMNAMVQLEAFDDMESPLDIAKCLWRFQRGSLDVMERLREAGVPDRSPTWASSAIDEILSHPVLQPKSDKLIELQSCVGEIKEICETLSGTKIPLTLVHGDYVQENLGAFEWVYDRSEVAVFDWYTCCIGHPLYDAVRGSLGFAFGIRDEEAKWYMTKWEEFESHENIELSRRLLEPLVILQNVFDLLTKYDSMEEMDQREWRDLIRKQAEAMLSALKEMKAST